jgi:hypothetical protein
MPAQSVLQLASSGGTRRGENAVRARACLNTGMENVELYRAFKASYTPYQPLPLTHLTSDKFVRFPALNPTTLECLWEDRR